MQRTLALLKQTMRPPKRVIPLTANPLTRWSRRLPLWCQLTRTLTGVAVGLEGCHSAFNATNSIRTCLYFQTAAPPTFLTAKSWTSIEHVQTRSTTNSEDPVVPSTSSAQAIKAEPASSNGNETENPFFGIANFGEEDFFNYSSQKKVQNGEETNTFIRDGPIVAVENFTDRARSLMQTRLPHELRDGCVRLVVGHENWGVRRSLLRAKDDAQNVPARMESPVADMVVYVPQYGTISSLNVVTSLGIALFYCYLDGAHPEARTVYRAATCEEEAAVLGVLEADRQTRELAELRRQIQAYQDYFKSSLPTPAAESNGKCESPPYVCDPVRGLALPDVNINTTPRVDRRPIHPVFYKQDMAEIRWRQQSYRQMLYEYSRGVTNNSNNNSCAEKGEEASTRALNEAAKFDNSVVAGGMAKPPASTHDAVVDSASSTRATESVQFGISVLYENEFDQRNFGGLIRNANAFLIDHIFYVGRRKYNVVGAVGSYHYTPPTYLGPLPSDEDGTPCEEEREKLSSDVRWSEQLKGEVQELCQTPGGTQQCRAWWLLDCGHDFLYEDEETSPESGVLSGSGAAAKDAKPCTSSPESLRMYKALLADRREHHLCETESSLRSALGDGLVLIVPQEGKLPHPALMRLCTGVLTVLPRGAHHSEVPPSGSVGGGEDAAKVTPPFSLGHRGLPSQVASGIALQRLSAVLHPRLAAI